MRVLNELSISKTMNSGYIFVEDKNRAKELRKVFDDMRIPYTKFVCKGNYFCIYGFKVFRIKKKFFELVAAIRRVTEC